MVTEKLTFEEWFKQGHESLIKLFCEFITEEKVYDITLDQFARFMYTQTTHGFDLNEEAWSREAVDVYTANGGS